MDRPSPTFLRWADGGGTNRAMTMDSRAFIDQSGRSQTAECLDARRGGRAPASSPLVWRSASSVTCPRTGTSASAFTTPPRRNRHRPAARRRLPRPPSGRRLPGPPPSSLGTARDRALRAPSARSRRAPGRPGQSRAPVQPVRAEPPRSKVCNFQTLWSHHPG